MNEDGMIERNELKSRICGKVEELRCFIDAEAKRQAKLHNSEGDDQLTEKDVITLGYMILHECVHQLERPWKEKMAAIVASEPPSFSGYMYVIDPSKTGER